MADSCLLFLTEIGQKRDRRGVLNLLQVEPIKHGLTAMLADSL
jgi:hypothetical protein